MFTWPQKIDFIFRLLVLLVTVTLGMIFLFFGARAAMAASLKNTAVIYGSVFTVGDIFSGVSKEAAEKVLGPAPQPGQDLILNARTLMRVAVAMDLPWRPASIADQVVLRRAATLVSSDNIQTVLEKTLRGEGIEGRFVITFTGMAAPQIVLPHDQAATVDVGMMAYDPQRGSFSATLMAPSKDNPLNELNVTGKIERIVSVPVVRKTLSGGDVINAYDISWVDMKESELQHDFILQENQIIGMTPRRMLMAGRPVRGNELERPQLVSRGSMITITYNYGPMILTAQGKAMQNGAQGDIVRVVNTSSNRTIDAFVAGENMVAVNP